MIRITIDNGKGPAVLEVVDEALKAENEVLNRDLIARAETVKDLRRQIEDLRGRADRYELQRVVAQDNAQQAEKWRKAATARTAEAVEAQGKVKDLEVLVAQMEADLNAKNRAAYEAIVNDPGSGEVEALRASNAELEAELTACRDTIRDGVSRAASLEKQVEAKKHVIEELRKEVAFWQKEAQDRNEAAEAANKRAASLEKYAEEKQAIIETLRKESTFWREKADGFNREEITRKAEHYEGVASDLAKEVDSLRASNAELKNKVEELGARLTTCRQVVAETQNALDATTGELGIVRAALALCQENRAELQLVANSNVALQLLTQRTDLEAKVAKLTEELKQSQEAKRKAETWAADERIATVEARAEVAKLTEELKQSREGGGELLMEARDLKVRLIEQQRENDRLKDEIEAMKLSARDAESGWLVEAASLRGEIERQRATVEALQSVIVAKDERIAEQKARIRALTSVPLTETIAAS